MSLPRPAGPGPAEAAARARPADLPWLTAVRAPVALWILLFHTSRAFLPGLPAGALRDVLSRAVSQAGLGVAFFYILSGFILTHVHGDRGVADRGRFYLARFARIWPVYMLSLLLSLPALSRESTTMLSLHGAAGGWARILVRAAGVLTFTQAWLPGMALFWNVVAWSVSCEAFFYLLFPWIVVRMRGLSAKALWGLLALCLLPMAGRFWLYRIHPTLHLNFNPLVRLPEFVAGVALAFLRARGARLDGRAAPAFVACALAAVCVPGEGLWRLTFLHVGFLGAILSLAEVRWRPTGPAWRSLVLLGQSSFALYLLHVPLAEFVLGRFGNSPFEWPLYAAVVLASSVAALRWVEDPARRLILSRTARRSAPGCP